MNKRNLLIALFISGSVIAVSTVFYAYQVFYAKIINQTAKNEVEFFIKPTDNIDEVTENLVRNSLLDSRSKLHFRFVSKFLEYNENVRAGRYVIPQNISNTELVRLLRSGAQTPVNVTFNSARLKADLAKKICSSLLADEAKFLEMLNNSEFVNQYGFDTLNIQSMFLPNTYQMYWTTDEKGLFDRMKREYDAFWNEKRTAKAKEINLTPKEVSVLASIVQAETAKNDEKPRVAGVYMNRLQKGMLLQADPTVIFSLGDFTIKRVLNKHLEYESPYNTYKNTGLPPGPINVPSPNSISAVLNYEKHDYIFFCASEDFNGYHNFAKTSAQHSRNAEKYRNALNAKKVYK